MSTKGEMSREQAVEIVGEAAVNNVERENCDFTNRVQCDGDTRVEFAASVSCEDTEGNDVTLIAYYYIEQSELDANEDNSLDVFNWKIEGYEVV